ncbi:MAG: hypothetical protein D6720_02820 [Gammaproteobacteria bacterium]|nr:MAG: hypothetical protein D6720_02820 [Gammaproteobacteria bacterium]
MSMLLALTGPAASATTGSPFLDMMRGMATGFALLGQNGTTTSPTIIYPPIQPLPVPAYSPFAPSYPWTASVPGWPPAVPFGTGIYPATPWPPTAPYPPGNILSKLEGAWETSNGGLLLVRDSLARLYVSRDEYQDLYLRADPRYLWLQPVGSQVPTRYEHHIYKDRIVLRDARGNSLVLRRYKPKRTTE